MDSDQASVHHTYFRRVLLKSLTPVILLAAFFCIALNILELSSSRALWGYVTAVLIVAVMELGLIWLSATMLLKKLGTRYRESSNGMDVMITEYPAFLTLRAVAVALLISPLVLIVITSTIGLDYYQILVDSVLAVVFSISSLTPLFYFTTQRVAWLFVQPHSFVFPRRRGNNPLLKVLSISIFIPAAAAALWLGVESERAVSDASAIALTSAYERAAKAALAVRPAAYAAEEVRNWTRFDKVSLFAFNHNDRVLRGLDNTDLAHMERAQKNGFKNTSIDRSRHVALVSLPATQDNVALGIRVAIEQRFTTFLGGLGLLVAGLFGASIAMVFHWTRLRSELRQFAFRLDALPERDISPSRRRVFSETRALTRNLNRLKGRFDVMRNTQAEAIVEGRRTRDHKSYLFVGMSHDLRSPLNSVIGFTDLILDGLDPAEHEMERKAVQRIAKESERLKISITDILDTSKLKAGRFELDRSWVPAVELVTGAIEDTRKLMTDSLVELETSFQPGLPPVYVDRDRVRQALARLMARVATATRVGSVKLKASLRYSGREDDKMLAIDFIDSGRGVSPAERNRISDAFVSVEGINHNGSGSVEIGMALARNIIELHDGELIVENEVNDECIVSVILPLNEPRK